MGAALLRMKHDGVLPPSQRWSIRVVRPAVSRAAPVSAPRSGPSAVHLNASEDRTPSSTTLGFTPMPGTQHFVRSANGETLAVLGFAAAAWCATEQAGRTPPAHLSSSTTQGSFLGSESNVLLPLAQVEQCLLDDRERRYALRPVLLETFCESLAGTRAAN